MEQVIQKGAEKFGEDEDMSHWARLNENVGEQMDAKNAKNIGSLISYDIADEETLQNIVDGKEGFKEDLGEEGRLMLGQFEATPQETTQRETGDTEETVEKGVVKKGVVKEIIEKHKSETCSSPTECLYCAGFFDRNLLSETEHAQLRRELERAQQQVKEAYLERTNDAVKALVASMESQEQVSIRGLRQRASLEKMVQYIEITKAALGLAEAPIGKGKGYYDLHGYLPVFKMMLKMWEFVDVYSGEVVLQTTKLVAGKTRKVDCLATRSGREAMIYINSVSKSDWEVQSKEDKVKLALALVRSWQSRSVVGCAPIADQFVRRDGMVWNFRIFTLALIEGQGFAVVELDNLDTPLFIASENQDACRMYKETMLGLWRVASWCGLENDPLGDKLQDDDLPSVMKSLSLSCNEEFFAVNQSLQKSQHHTSAKQCPCSAYTVGVDLHHDELTRVQLATDGHGSIVVVKGIADKMPMDYCGAVKCAKTEVQAYNNLKKFLVKKRTASVHVAAAVDLCFKHSRVYLPRLCSIEWDTIDGGSLAVDMIHGLMTLHAADMAHCDLKPNAWMMDSSGRAVLLDLNLAICNASTVSEDDVPLGTPGWSVQFNVLLPPQANDVRTMGVVLAWMLSDGFRQALEECDRENYAPDDLWMRVALDKYCRTSCPIAVSLYYNRITLQQALEALASS